MLYWFFYIPLTAFVIIALVTTPTSILNQSVQPFRLDAGITEERLYEKVSDYSPILGTQYGTLTDQFDKNAALLLSDKRYAYKISAGQKAYVANKEFYEDAVPLAPIRYNRYTITKMFTSNGKQIPVTIDQVYPKSYEKIQ
ncbi:Uncharacterised protein [uncultured archaeon]|nr:Uncharacterised protein [uncultured archaeon]